MKTACLWSLLACLIYACARMSPEECQTTNWTEQGKVDGMEGKPANTFVNYVKLCAEHEVVLDQAPYNEGRMQGLTYFCTEAKGREFARAGEKYNGVCPLKLEPDFLRGYYLGQKEHELDKREEALNRRAQEVSDQQVLLRSQQTQALVPRPIVIAEPKQCSFNSDCVIKDKCTFFKCNKTGRVCNFDSDCSLQGACSMLSRTCTY